MCVQCLPCTTKNLAGEEGFEPSHAGIKIQCLNQLGDSPTRVDGKMPPTYKFSNKLLLLAHPSKGWTGKLLHNLAGNALAAACQSTARKMGANTALPGPVIRPLSPSDASQSRAWVMPGQSFWATLCKSL